MECLLNEVVLASQECEKSPEWYQLETALSRSLPMVGHAGEKWAGIARQGVEESQVDAPEKQRS